MNDDSEMRVFPEGFDDYLERDLRVLLEQGLNIKGFYVVLG